MTDEMEWSRELDSLVLVRASGKQPLPGDESELSLAEVGAVTIASVRAALIAREYDGEGYGFEHGDHGVPIRLGLGVVSDEPSRLHRLGTLPPMYLYLDPEDELVFSMTAGIGYYVEESEIESLVEPVLDRCGARLLRIWIDDDGPRSEWWQFSVRLPWEGRTLSDLYRDCLAIGTAIQFPTVEELQPATVLEILRAGYVENLIGQSESDWLEVKSRPYDFHHRREHRLELPKDVARFANSESGGLLLIGLEEENEIVTRIRPVAPDRRRLQSYRDSLNHYLYPPVEGLRLETVTVRDGEVIAILVPPQKEGLKPFIVRGATVEGKVDMTYVSIVRRRGDKSIATSAEELHSWLSAGRAFLRR